MSLAKGLIAKQIFTSKAAAEFLQKAEDIGDAVDCREVESVLFSVKYGCGVEQTGLSMLAGPLHSAAGI